MKEANYYSIIPANVRYDEILSDRAKLLYGEISALSNKEGYCWATNAHFAELFKVSKKSISRNIQELVDRGYIISKILYEDKVVTERRLYINSYYGEILTPMDKTVHTPMEKLSIPLWTKLSNVIIQVLIIQVLIYIVELLII